MKVRIQNGRAVFVASQALAEVESLGTCHKTRASHVEPINPFLRWCFHLIRRRVADESRLAAWTRRWPCLWRARIFGGPILEPFADRKAAIDAEVEWLESQ